MNRKIQKNISFALLTAFIFVTLLGGLSLGLNSPVKAATLLSDGSFSTVNQLSGAFTAGTQSLNTWYTQKGNNYASCSTSGGNTGNYLKLGYYGSQAVIALSAPSSAQTWTISFNSKMPSTVWGGPSFKVLGLTNGQSVSYGYGGCSGGTLLYSNTNTGRETSWTNKSYSVSVLAGYNVIVLEWFSDQGGEGGLDNVSVQNNVGGSTSTPTLVPTSTSTPTPASTSTPTPAAGTIGNTVDGTTTDNVAGNYYNAIKYQASSNMTVTQMKIKVATAGTGKMKCAIYSDNAGNVGSFLMGTAERSTLGTGWQTFSLTSSLSLTSGTYYWLVSWRDGNYGISSTTSTGCNRWGTLTYTASWPTNLPTYQGTADYRHSLYAIGGATPTPGSTATPTSVATATPTSVATATPTGIGTATPTPSTGMKMGTNFWFHAGPKTGSWTGETAFKTGINWGTAYSSGTDVWNPTFFNELQPYSTLRFMDWGSTNNSNQVNWSTRRQPTDDQANIDNTIDSPGIAYEWMIDLCNRTMNDMWLCIPHQANWDYSYQLATLVKNKLNSSLKCYIEYSNETWNFGFGQAGYCKDQGVALNLQPAGFDTLDQYGKGYAYHVYAAVRHFKQFDTVFAGQSSRIVKVISGQTGSGWIASLHMAALKDPVINPDNVKANAYSIAPYIGHNVNGSAGDAVTQLRNLIPTAVSETTAVRNQVVPNGLAFLAYEGGQHVLNGADIVNRNSGMYQLYIDYFNALKPYYSLFVNYARTGVYGSGGAWGAQERTGQSLSTAHKLRAIYDWINANP